MTIPTVTTSTGHTLTVGDYLYIAVSSEDLAKAEVIDVDGDVATVVVSGPPRVHYEHHLEPALGTMKRRSTWWYRNPPWGKSVWMVFGTIT